MPPGGGAWQGRMRSMPGSGEKVARFSMTVTPRRSLAFAGGGEGGADLLLELGQGLLARDVEPIAGGADHAMHAFALGVLAEEPLERALKERGVGVAKHRTIEPQVSAEDRHAFELIERSESLIPLLPFRRNPSLHGMMIGREDHRIGGEGFAGLQRGRR